MLVVMVVMAVVAMAQNPNKISYQAVVRDGQNRLVTNSDVTVQVKIGTYVDTFNVTTNANGLVSLQIPSDAKQTVFNAIDWTSTNTITTTVTIVSTSEAMTSTVPVSAVPYSLYANTVNPAVFDVIYDKIQADSVVLQDSILATATAIRGEMSAMQNALQHNIDTTSSQIRHDMNTMTSDLQDNIDSTSVNVRKALVDTAANIRSAVNTNAANIATNKQAIIDSAHNIRTEMAAMTSDLQSNIDTTSARVRAALVDTAGNIRIDVNAKFAALATVATTGSYTDLNNIPVGLVDSNFVRGQISDTADVLRGEIAAAQVQADWNEDVATSKAYIKNKPTLMDSLAVIRTVKDTADAIRSAIPEVAEGKYSLVNPLTKKVVSTINVNYTDSMGIVLPGNPLHLKFRKNGTELVDYNAFGTWMVQDVDMTDTSYVIDLSETITTQAIVNYINNAQATATVNDVDSIYNALTASGNEDVYNALLRKAQEIAMNHRREAIEVGINYFKNISKDDIRYVLDNITGSDISRFIDSLHHTVTATDLNNIMSAISSNISTEQIGYFVKAVADNISAAQVVAIVNAVSENITAAQVNVLIDAFNSAAAANPTGSAAQLKARLRDYIQSIIDNQ